MEQRIYDAQTETIKSIVISIRDYHVRRELIPDMYRFNVSDEQRIDMVKMAEHRVKRELLEGLEKFIHCTIDKERNFVEAQAWMPYVKDDVVKSLEETERYQTRIIGELQAQNRNLRKRITYLEMPWWKKFWLKVKQPVHKP